VFKIAQQLRDALQAEQVVLGGGNAKKLKKLPPRTRLGENANAFVGGFRIWEEDPPARTRAASRN
jgi:polyphosphate glucokinase